MGEELKNIFATGEVAIGDSFIGRKEELGRIERELLNNKTVNVFGIARIGKSSLMEALISRFKEKGYLCVKIDFSSYSKDNAKGYLSIFEGILKKFANELKRDQRLWQSIQEAEDFHTAINQLRKLKNEEWESEIRDLWEKLSCFADDNDFKLLFVFDEFDKVRDFFNANNQAEYSRLLEIVNPQNNISAVFVSRVKMDDIEKAAGIDNLSKRFLKRRLSVFNDEDMVEYYDKLAAYEIQDKGSDEEIKKRINYYCGKVPILLSNIAYELVEQKLEQRNIDVDIAYQRAEATFSDIYKDILNNLRSEEGLFEPFARVFLGPAIEIKQVELDVLAIKGYLIFDTDQAGEKKYSAISPWFEEYFVEDNACPASELQALLDSAILSMRKIIFAGYRKKYGEDGYSRLVEDVLHYRIAGMNKIGLGTYLDKDRKEISYSSFVATNVKNGGNSNILIALSIEELAKIIFLNWEKNAGLEVWFKGDAEEWKKRFSALHYARNPLAHVNAVILDRMQLGDAKYSAEKINSLPGVNTLAAELGDGKYYYKILLKKLELKWRQEEDNSLYKSNRLAAETKGNMKITKKLDNGLYGVLEGKDCYYKKGPQDNTKWNEVEVGKEVLAEVKSFDELYGNNVVSLIF